MWTVFKSSLKNKWSIFLILTVICLLFLWLYASVLPPIISQMDVYNKLLATMPQGLLTAFNFDINSMASFEGFLSSENFGVLWPIMVIVLINSVAGWTLAGEIEKGPMDLLLAQPVSRRKVFWGKYLSGLSLVFLFTVATVLTSIPLAQYYQLDYQAVHFYTFAIIAFLFAWSIYSLSFLFSSMARDAGKATMPALLIVIVSYAINIVSRLKDNLKDLQYVSIFHYFDPVVTLEHGQLDPHSILMFAGIIVVCTLLAAQIFQRRDLNA
jgi:ABC-2 type transport system permease protein